QQPLLQNPEIVARHIHDERGVAGQAVRPVCNVVGMLAAACYQNHSGRNIAMGEGNVNSGGGAQDGSDSGNNLNLDPRLAQCYELFPASAEDEGIPAFQADHLKSQERVLRQQAIDLFLWSALLSA